MIRFRHVLPALAAASLLCLAGCQSSSPMIQAADDGWNGYGATDGDVEGPVMALGALEGGETDVVIEATIVEVCTKKGCWMTVTDGETEVFVRFKDYGFFVPMNAAGHAVTLHGITESKLTPVDELRHYAEDAGTSPAEIAAITEPAQRMTLYADSVFIEGPGLDDPFGSGATSAPAGH